MISKTNKGSLVGYGLLTLVIITIGSLIFKAHLLLAVCIVIWVALCGIGQSIIDTETQRIAEESVNKNGVEWAIRELVLNPRMSTARKSGLKKAINKNT